MAKGRSDDDDDVYYYIRWRLELEGETEKWIARNILFITYDVYYKTLEVFFLSSEGSREEGVHGC